MVQPASYWVDGYWETVVPGHYEWVPAQQVWHDGYQYWVNDSTPPVLSITGFSPVPAAGQPRKITVTWSASDSGGGISYVELWCTNNGAGWMAAEGTAASGSTTFEVATGRIYSCEATAWDKDNNSTTAEISFAPEASVPIVEIAITPLMPPAGSRFDVSWRASDSRALTNVKVTQQTSGSTATLSTATTGTASVVAVANTTYMFTIIAEDMWGNANGASTSVTVAPPDTIKPTGSMTLPPYVSGYPVDVTLSASDNSGSVALMRVWGDGSDSGWIPYATTRSWTPSSGDGTKTLNAQYKDASGNLSDTYSASTQRESTVPTCRAASPPTASGPFQVSWTGTDAPSGIREYDLFYKQGTGGVWNAWLTGTTSLSSSFSAGDAGNTYYFACVATDRAGNRGSFDVNGNGDTQTALSGTLISNLRVEDKTGTSATIRWTSNIDITTKLQYGVEAVTQNTVGDNTFAKDHTVRLSGLAPETTYLYRVYSLDIYGNLLVGETLSFQTDPWVGQVIITPLKEGKTAVSWTTVIDQPSIVSYGVGLTNLMKEEPAVGKSHQLMINTPDAGTEYRIVIREAAGHDYATTFTTPPEIIYRISWVGEAQERGPQGGSNWCWAAATQGAMAFHGRAVTQKQIVAAGLDMSLSDPNLSPDNPDTGGYPWDSVEAIVELGQGMSATWGAAPIADWSRALDELYTPNPILVFVKYDGPANPGDPVGHTMSIIGFKTNSTGEHQVLLWDPWDKLEYDPTWEVMKDSTTGDPGIGTIAGWNWATYVSNLSH